MQYFFYILTIPFLILNYKILISDLKNKIIPNKLLGYLLLLLPFFYIYFFSTYQEINYYIFAIKIFVSFIVSFILYSFWIWSAWDAKYLLILSLFVPYIEITYLIWNLSLLTISYLFIYFIYFYFWKILFLKDFRNKIYKNVKIDLNEKWSNYKNNKHWKTLSIVTKFLIIFFLIFVSIRLLRIYLFNWIINNQLLNENISSLIIEKLSIYLIIFVILVSLWVLILFKKFYAKVSKRLSEEFTKHNINTNYVKTFLTFILLLSLLSFVWYEYIKDSELITSTLYRIFTIYLLLYLIIKIVIFSYKITFWIAESNLIDVQYLKKWDIIDKQYLIKMLWKQDSLWASWKDTNKEWLFYPDPIEYIKSMNTVLEAEEVDIIKKAYEKVNSSISLENKEVEIHKIKIMNTFAFSPYIFIWFIFTFIVEDKLIKYIVEFSVNTIKGVN